ncbi:MAG: replication-associated recombination protein A [Gammaproteobacteria bacterium]|nr:replication-associated recombination protein A [Gammaproteobacteria bacterium]
MHDQQASLLERGAAHRPLAERARPLSLEGFFGQQHLLGPDAPLRRMLDGGALHSMVLWGPPGTGKTTLARMLARHARARFVTLSAVLSGVKDIRDAVGVAQQERAGGRQTVLFVDEAHRFNKAQQDAFLPHVEDGTVVFVGATTENPAFELNNALLSRVRVYVLKSLTSEDLGRLLDAVMQDTDSFAGLSVTIADDARDVLLAAADGDARRLLLQLEIAADLAPALADRRVITRDTLDSVLQTSLRRFDKGGDAFYDQISALHKSIRGSDPDAALYWLCRMLDGGCDPNYVARRLLRITSEDVGNADPRALSIVLDAWEAYRRLGSPEGELALAHVAVYLACVPKSNAVYTAFNAAMQKARDSGSLEVPQHLRNAPTALAAQLGYGQGYRYAHDEQDGFAAGERYLPEALGDAQFYVPLPRGLEEKIALRMQELRERNLSAREGQEQ